MQTSVAPSVPGFNRLLSDLFDAEEVPVGFARAAAEGAELAADKTDIGEIDIAIDDVGDEIADQFAAKQRQRRPTGRVDRRLRRERAAGIVHVRARCHPGFRALDQERRAPRIMREAASGQSSEGKLSSREYFPRLASGRTSASTRVRHGSILRSANINETNHTWPAELDLARVPRPGR